MNLLRWRKPFVFAGVGITGLCIDVGITTGLTMLGLPSLAARPIAVAIAVQATWYLNRSATFQTGKQQRADLSRIRGIAAENLRYVLVSALSATINYSVFATLLLLWPDMPVVLAILSGSLVAMIASYYGVSRLVFRESYEKRTT